MNAEARDPRAFLAGGGEMGALIRAHDWSSTSLGPPEGWPQPLRTTLRTVLTTGHPAFVFWGPDHTCFYNDAYRRSIGPEKHPAILGIPGREAWPEIWDIIGPQIAMVLRGEGATWHEDQLVPIRRHGAIQEVYWTYSYGPIHDDSAPGGVGGVLVLCQETTQQVLGERRLRESETRLAQIFEQAPTFMAQLVGPEHRFERANPGYLRLVGGRPVVGRPVAEALPEAAEQGYVGILDRVYRTGEPYVARGARFAFADGPDGRIVQRYVDFVYQPIRGPDGAVTGIFVEGADVTDRTLATLALSEGEALQRMLVALGDRLRPLENSHAITAAAAEVLGTTLGVARVGYAEVDEDGIAAVYREWNPGGLPTLVGRHRLDAYGAVRLAGLRAGRTDAVGDVGADPRLTPAEAETFRRSGIAAAVVVPLVKAGRLSALLFVHDAAPRDWTAAEVRAVGEVAERTWDAVERARAEAEARDAERRHALLVRLTDDIRDATDPAELAHAAAALLGEALGIGRVGYGTVDHDAEVVTIERDWTAPGVESIAGTHRFRRYGSFVESLKAGELVAIADVRGDPRSAGGAEPLVALGIRSLVNIPVLEAGRLVALFFLHDPEVRHWPAAEIALVREVAERTRTAAERLRGVAALAESEERLRLALAAGKLGTWDYDAGADRIVGDVAFAALYGLDPARAASGVTLAEVLERVHPEDRDRVMAGVRRLLARPRNEATAAEYRVIGRDGAVRWVSARAQRHDDAEGRAVRLPGVALDVTERRQAEERAALLLALGDRIRDVDDPAELSYAAAELLGRALGVSRAGYGTIDAAAETITIERDWNAPGIRSLAGVLQFRDYGSYIEDLKRGETVVFADARTDPRTAATAGALEAISARAVVNMPVSERGGPVALLYLNHEDAREWTAEELSLIREVAERTRTAVERLRAEAARREGDERYRVLFDSLDAGFCVIEVRPGGDDVPADYRFLEVNPAFGRHTGLTGVVGHWIRDVVPTHEEHWFDIYAHVAETGESVRFEQGAKALNDRWFDVHAFRLGPAELRQVAVFFNDISGRRRAEMRVLQSEARYRALVETSSAVVWSADAEGGMAAENPSWGTFTGQSPGEYRGWGWLEAIHPEDRDHASMLWRTAIASLSPYECAYRLRRHDGVWRWTLARGTPVFDAGGRLREWIGANADETERRAAEERQALLMREVDHRAKNALAVVQATLRLTRAEDLPSFVRAIEGRVGALARAQTLLADDRWAGADLRALVQGEVTPFLSGEAARVTLRGARVALPAGAAQPIAMALHELATNAVKYGALSVPEGRVAISWTVLPGEEETLRLDWVESGGPPIAAPPTRRGFGTRVLDGTVATQLGGAVEQDWRPDGLACRITVPLARARAAAEGR